MTKEIPRSEWKQFFDVMSRDLANTETAIQILSAETGAQMLSEGLPFNGAAYDEETGTLSMTVGRGPDHHQTHSITDLQLVAFRDEGDGPRQTLDIEDGSGTKTLVTFLRAAGAPS